MSERYIATYCVEMLKDFTVFADSEDEAWELAAEKLEKWQQTAAAQKLMLGDPEQFCIELVEQRQRG